MSSSPSFKIHRYRDSQYFRIPNPLLFPHIVFFLSLRFVIARFALGFNSRGVCFSKDDASIYGIFKFLVMFGKVSSSYQDVVMEVVQHYLTEERPFFITSHYFSQLKLLHSLFPNNCFSLDINLENESLDSFTDFRIRSLRVDYLKPGLFDLINCCSLVLYQCQYDENCVFLSYWKTMYPIWRQ
ncbi:hypothetical protein RCL1_008270 [Eukaryota sp. TZLM3-RCL]